MLLYWLCDNQRLVEELIILIPKCQTFLQFLKLLLCLSVNYIWLNLGNCIFWGNYFELLNISLLVLSSDGSGSKNFDPRWVNFLWLWSGRVWSGQPFMVWVWIWKISPENVKFFNFFPFRSKKISLGWVRKYPGQRRVSILLRVKSMLGLGQGPSLVLSQLS